MTVRNLFRAEGCSCNDTGKLRAALEGLPEPLCAVHEADAIAARAKADLDQATIREALRATSPPEPSPAFLGLNSDRSVKDALESAPERPSPKPTTPRRSTRPEPEGNKPMAIDLEGTICTALRATEGAAAPTSLPQDITDALGTCEAVLAFEVPERDLDAPHHRGRPAGDHRALRGRAPRQASSERREATRA
jgi:hypothetical protein